MRKLKLRGLLKVKLSQIKTFFRDALLGRMNQEQTGPRGQKGLGNGVGQGGRSEMQSRAENHSKQSQNNFVINTSKWPAPLPLLWTWACHMGSCSHENCCSLQDLRRHREILPYKWNCSQLLWSPCFAEQLARCLQN